MTNYDAIMSLLRETRTPRTSTTGERRIVKACKRVCLDDAETLRVLQWLEYCQHDGRPWSSAIEQVWRIPENAT